ncbi:SDR family NAD(P)-dependent oxidoreductase [Granulosicoccus sp. 3-233]|uniref:SDR family NAD(P)-dependent oxidoreductase n=1 Tax=Granulosicoccus sp. 3-233 TaxID=3417969 RepID=UPI003D33AFEC
MTHPLFGSLFDGRTVVITGAGRGIGRAVLLDFHAAGASIIAHLGRQAEHAAGLPEDIDWFCSDFTTPEGQQAFIDHVQQNSRRVDVLINNAGTMFGRFPADTLTDEQYQMIIELNQNAVVRITRAMLPLLKAADKASIINTVSISASTGGSPGSSIYSASKAFVSTYSRGLARELAPFGIRVNAVSPGVIDTDFHGRYSSKEKLETTRQQIPLQRLGTSEDCAPAFLFFAAEELSGYITGQVLEINGGQR